MTTSTAESAEFYEAPGTRRMAERLERLHRETKPMDNPFLNQRRADELRGLLERLRQQPLVPQTLSSLYNFQTKYAIELLNGGQSQAAIDELRHVKELLTTNGLYQAQQKEWVESRLALAYLRLGEQQNCLNRHTPDSCLLPIQGGGIHQLPEGSRQAVRLLRQLLSGPDQDWEDAQSRWLLNIAYMTLGEYPEKVPPAMLIPPQTFASDYDIKRFYDVAPGLGLDLDGLAGSVIMDDFDGDGYLDLMVSEWGLEDPLHYFRNQQDGSFQDRTKEAGLARELGGLNMIQADYNNDGHLDFLMLRGAWFGKAGHHPNSLLRNNGNGTFDDVTEEAGLLSFHPTQTAVWFDYNNDGWIDLFIGNESAQGDIEHPCELYRNNGNGTFTECAAEAGVNLVAFVKGVGSADYNNDGRPDLYLACRGNPNILLRNDGPQKTGGQTASWKFTNVSEAAGVTEPLYSFPTWFFDYDNDGWPDLFAAGYAVRNVGDVALDYLGRPHPAERSRLFHNNRDGTFTDVTKAAGLYKVLLAMPGNFGDLDNDGFLDFYLGTGDPNLTTIIPNRMFRNDGGRRFQDVTTSGGFGHLQKGHGIAFGDLDNDGDQDVYESIGGAYEGDNYRNVLFHNPGHGHHWITLKLEGTRSNRAALGARVKVEVITSNGVQAFHRTVGSGGSFGASPLRQEIGLGEARAIKEVQITWPVSGMVQTFTNLAMDRFWRIKENDPTPAELNLQILKLDHGGPMQGHHLHSGKP